MKKNCRSCRFWQQIKPYFRKCGLNDGDKCDYVMDLRQAADPA